MNIIPISQGRQSQQDLSYQWVQQNNQLFQMESGIQILKFHQEADKRSPQVQFKILQHMTQTTIHLNKLYKNPIQFSYNRYNNILPFQYSMVKLNNIQGNVEAEKYINANYINTVVKDQRVIATQGPLSTTVYNFWRMVDENNIKVIYMLCNLEQRKKVKCYKYWPCQAQKILTIPHYELELLSQKELDDHLLEKKIRVKGLSTNLNRIITHYHWKQWKDNEAPKYQSIHVFQKLIDLAIQHIQNKNEILVHCSAGIGRTGTFIAMLNIKLILRYYAEQRLKQNFEAEKMKLSIFGIVRRLREQRWGMVYKKQQYEFLYTCTRKLIIEIFDIQEDL